MKESKFANFGVRTEIGMEDRLDKLYGLGQMDNMILLTDKIAVFRGKRLSIDELHLIALLCVLDILGFTADEL